MLSKEGVVPPEFPTMPSPIVAGLSVVDATPSFGNIPANFVGEHLDGTPWHKPSFLNREYKTNT